MPRTTTPVRPPGTTHSLAQPVLIDRDLLLRPWVDEDVDAIVSAYTDPAIRRWHARTMTAVEAQEYITAANTDWPAGTRASWAVTAGDTVVGRTSLKFDLHEGLASVGYWVVRTARGRGVATRALDAVAAWGVATLGLHRVELEHSTLNGPSCRVAVKTGFDLESTRQSVALHDDGWHDMHVHVLFGSPRTRAGARAD